MEAEKAYFDFGGGVDNFVIGVRYHITPHFLEQASIRMCWPKGKPLNTILEKVFTGSVVIEERPNNVKNIIDNNFCESVYLYNVSYDSVIVLEKHKSTADYRVLKTVYRGSQSKWLDVWKKTNIENKKDVTWRKWFRKQYKITINDI